MARTNWIDVDLDGLRQVLARRGKEFAVFELVQNAWDEQASAVGISLTAPVRGRSELSVRDDSPDGFRDLADAWTMFAPSYKKTDPTKRGAFNLGEKLVLALCDEVTITSTTGRVTFGEKGRTLSKHPSHRSEAGTEFRGHLRLTQGEYERIVERVQYLIPPVTTVFNGKTIHERKPLASFEIELPTTIADAEGYLRRTRRITTVYMFEPLPGEKPMLYEMGIPVVETGDTWHVDISQKVPLNTERDNVPPAYLTAVRVATVNAMALRLDKNKAAEPWVRVAASDPRISERAFDRIMQLRFGTNRVSYDPSDIGSNREASSQDYTVITGGSLSAGEWENARRYDAVRPAGQLFATNHGAKTPDKEYDRNDWSPEMLAYDRFVKKVSPALVGHEVGVRYIEDRKMVCGQFFGTWFNVNLARHDVKSWQCNIELMLHELAHTVVQSNDHLSHQFYETVGKLGSKLALLIARNPDLAQMLREV